MYPIDNYIRSNKAFVHSRQRIDLLLPLDLETVKQWLKMDGITEDDDLIMELIEDAFNFVELVCGLSLVPTQISTTLEVLNRIELPYGPIIGDLIISSTVSSTALSNPLPDTGFVLFSACTGSYFATYTAGYVNWVDVPAGIKGAIKAYIAYCYEHRGDDYDVSDPGFASVAMRKLFPYKRTLGV